MPTSVPARPAPDQAPGSPRVREPAPATGRGTGRSYWRRARWSRWATCIAFVTPGLALFGLFVLWPLAQTIILSFQRWNGFTSPQWAGAANYLSLLGQGPFWAALEHTAIYAVGTVIAKVALGLGLALLLDRAIRGRSFYRSVVFAPALMSFVTVGVLWQLIYAPSLGLADRFLAVLHLGGGSTDWLGSPNLALPSVMFVDVWKWVGYHAVLFLAGLSLVSQELREAARTDGASAFREFWHVTLPALRGMIVLNIIFAGAGAFNTFDLVYVMTDGGPYGKTDVLMTYLYRLGFTNSSFGEASAVACVLLAIVGVFTLVMLRLSRSDYDAK